MSPHESLALAEVWAPVPSVTGGRWKETALKMLPWGNHSSCSSFANRLHALPPAAVPSAHLCSRSFSLCLSPRTPQDTCGPCAHLLFQSALRSQPPSAPRGLPSGSMGTGNRAGMVLGLASRWSNHPRHGLTPPEVVGALLAPQVQSQLVGSSPHSWGTQPCPPSHHPHIHFAPSAICFLACLSCGRDALSATGWSWCTEQVTSPSSSETSQDNLTSSLRFKSSGSTVFKKSLPSFLSIHSTAALDSPGFRSYSRRSNKNKDDFQSVSL